MKPIRLVMMACAVAATAMLQDAGPAAAENVHAEPGVKLELVLLPADAEGNLRGALSIELEPGWKTYWVDPGPVGLAPVLDFGASEGISEIQVRYPLPQRFAEGDVTSTGYLGPTSFALSGQATGEPHLRLQYRLGICREICVPVVGSLDAEPSKRLGAHSAVNWAFSNLPVEEPAAASGWRARLQPGGEALELTGPEGGGKITDIFLAGPLGWSFGQPHPSLSAPGDATRFSVPVLHQPANLSDPLTVDLLLTAGESARNIRALSVPHG